jgi:hypothetical protein
MKTLNFSSTIRRKKLILVPIIAILLVLGLATAAVFTMYYADITATVKTPDIQLAAGADNSTSTSYPNASVIVASTYDYATVAFSLFPSEGNTPQPDTYYTDLLQIKNVGTANHTINSIIITSLTGETNLGNVTIYYYDTQTDTPTTGTPIGAASLTDISTAPVTIFTGAQGIAGGATNYIELVGHAASDAAVDSTVNFVVSIQWI